MTIHSAKGLEFENVFIVGLEEGIFPHRNSFDSIEQMEEERRLCYVAITRAKRNLYLVNARRRMIFGDSACNPPSRFLEEIDKKCLNIEDNEQKFDKDAMIDDTIEYKIGDRVLHEIYGEGIIISMDKTILTVAFPHPHEIKKLMKGHKSFRKVD